MPQFTECYINPDTGEIDHVVTSDCPITHRHILSHAPSGKPYEVEALELDDHPDGLQRADRLRERLEAKAGAVEFCASAKARDRQTIRRREKVPKPEAEPAE
jgi:hypothetical protein